jgi:para-nitrobenzyl esterase
MPRSPLAALLLLAAHAAAQEDPRGPRIEAPIAVEGGELEDGEPSAIGKVRCWRGIPYAAPPVGELRWKPPQPVIPWKGRLNATDFGPACPQPPCPLAIPPDSGEVLDEDCLRLNVWTPARRTKEKLPVFVWVHGWAGGHTVGSGAQGLYDGELLAGRGVVVVTFNRRLGVFGWLAHPALSKESPDGTSGNLGLQDILAALRWVRRNIERFGGDPANVTLAGQSGGAECVALLMVCPKAEGLFHKAILQSGGASRVRRTLRDAEAQGEAYVKRLGCPPEAAAMRAKTAEELLAAALHAAGPFAAGEVWGPVIDGVLVPDDPWTLWRGGRTMAIPVLAGANAHDGSMFPLPEGVVDVWQYRDWLRAAFPADPGAVFKAYAPPLRDDVPATFRELLTDAAFAEPARFLARSHAAAGRPAWLYHFERVSPGSAKRSIGAFHGAEAAYMFGNLVGPVGYEQADHAVAGKMCDAWAAFAKSGNPAHEGLPDWPRHDATSDAWMVFGDDARVEREVRKERLDVLSRCAEGERAKGK